MDNLSQCLTSKAPRPAKTKEYIDQQVELLRDLISSLRATDPSGSWLPAMNQAVEQCCLAADAQLDRLLAYGANIDPF